MASTSKEEFYTKEELEEIKYPKLLELDKKYSFRTSKKTKSTKMNQDAIIKRLVKNGVPKANRMYAFNHPLVEPLPSGTSLSSDVVKIIYSIKKTKEFVESIFEPKTLPSKQSDFFDFVLNGGSKVHLSITDESLEMYIKNLYHPNFFIKDYDYLVKKFINAKKTDIVDFFRLQVIPTYSRIIVIEKIIQKIEAYRRSHPTLPKYPQEIASKLLEASYERYYTPPNNPIYVLKIYIKELNKMLSNLRSYKIILENSIIKHLNNKLDKLNTYLVEPDPSIVGQANAKFYIRIFENSSKYLTKTRKGSPHKKSRIKTLKRAKSF
jgi:hypothetical protein